MMVMNLPPLPETKLHNKVEKFYTTEQMQAYGELCVKEYKVSMFAKRSHPKFSDVDVAAIRQMHAQGFNYKAISRKIDMSEVTFINIIKRRGAYK